MFDLEKAIASWRGSIHYNRNFLESDLDELERHIRDQVASLVGDGLTEAKAFERAMREIGDYESVEREYEKVYWHKLLHRRLVLREIRWHFAMLQNSLKIALRSFRRYPGYSAVNMA